MINENNSDSDSDSDYDEMVERISSKNKATLLKFEAYLQKKKLSVKTIKQHSSNIAFYGNSFIMNYADEEMTVDKAPFYINTFLGSWFIRKCMWASQPSIKSYITSFKKFYGWLHEEGSLTTEDHKEFLQMIKDEKDEWLETMRKYDDSDVDFEDIF